MYIGIEFGGGWRYIDDLEFVFVYFIFLGWGEGR